jgi:hypothetical protein
MNNKKRNKKMECSECTGEYSEELGTLTVPDPYVGLIRLKDVTYYICPDCSDILYTEETSEAIFKKRLEQIQEFVNNYPIKDFFSTSDAASILSISRQALHKNQRIRRGFIYQSKLGSSLFYLKQSVYLYKDNLYKDTGDGRFPLFNQAYDYAVTAPRTSSVNQIITEYDRPSNYSKVRSHFTSIHRTIHKEYNYANE